MFTAMLARINLLARTVLLAVLLCCASACGGGSGGSLDSNFPPLAQSQQDVEARFAKFISYLNNGDYDSALAYTSKHVYWRYGNNDHGQTPTKDYLLQYKSFAITYTVASFTQHEDTAVLTFALQLKAVALPSNLLGDLTINETQSATFQYEDGAWLLYGIFVTPPPAVHNEGAGSNI